MLVKNLSSSKLYRLKVISVLNWLDDLIFFILQLYERELQQSGNKTVIVSYIRNEKGQESCCLAWTVLTRRIKPSYYPPQCQLDPRKNALWYNGESLRKTCCKLHGKETFFQKQTCWCSWEKEFE